MIFKKFFFIGILSLSCILTGCSNEVYYEEETNVAEEQVERSRSYTEFDDIDEFWEYATNRYPIVSEYQDMKDRVYNEQSVIIEGVILSS